MKDVDQEARRARDCFVSIQARMKKNVDEHGRDIEFSVGDEMLLNRKNIPLVTVDGSKNLQPRFVAPYQILKRIEELANELDLSKSISQSHPVLYVSFPKPYHPDSEVVPPPQPTVIDGEPDFEVGQIPRHRQCKRGGSLIQPTL